MQDVLITGAARGFGLALARAFSRECRVFACARNAANRRQLQTLHEERPEQVVPIRFDVTEDHDLYRARQLVENETESLDIVVNNAGINAAATERPEAHTTLEKLDGTEMLKAFHVNAVAPVLVVQAFLELLTRPDEPRVVNISSDAGSITNKTSSGNYSYAASKAALNMMTKALANEVRTHEIVVTSVHPGHLQTKMGGPTAPDSPDEAADDLYQFVQELSMKDTGTFVTRNGQEMSW